MKRAAAKTTKHLRHSKRYEPMVTSHLQLKQHEQANKQASLVHMSFSISLSHSPPLLQIMKGIGNVEKVFKPQLMSYLRLQNTTFPPKTWAQHGTIGKKKQALEKKKEKKSHWHSLKCHNMRQGEWGGGVVCNIREERMGSENTCATPHSFHSCLTLVVLSGRCCQRHIAGHVAWQQLWTSSLTDLRGLLFSCVFFQAEVLFYR